VTAPCPCGSGRRYRACCGAWHAAFAAGQGLQAPTPEALMRSRYAAFVLDLRPYLLASWHASTRPAALEPPEPGLKWLGLEVKRAALQDADHGSVEFVARNKLGGRAHRLHETSRFVREGGAWFYVDGRFGDGPEN
jgi:SEC-C motif-containing protein